MSEYSTSNNSGRYTSKKYNASPNPGGTRGGNTRARLLTSKKVSAPLPLNLPSLRREHASGSDQGSASPNASASGWGSSPAEESIASPPQTSLSPASPPHRAWSATASSKSDTLDQADSHSSDHPHPHHTPASPPPPPPPAASSSFKTALTSSPSGDPSKPPEQNPPSTRKTSSVLDEFETDSMDWDEMVRQDLEEHEDGHESTPVATAEEEEEGYSSPVPPSERFTEDYDRSYPPQLRRTPPDTHPHDTSSSTSSSSWARKGSVDRGTGRRASEGRPQRHFSGDRRPRTYSQRRLSQENHRAAFQPTVLQRPRRPSSVTSDPHQPQPAQANANDPASQREVMLTAAERAKARRDAEEAEFEAARERARKKAEALAALAKKDETEKVSADDKASPKDKVQSTEKASPEDRTTSVEKAASVEKTAPEDIPSQDKVPSVEEVSPEDKAPSEDKTPSEDKAASEDKSLPGDSVSPEKEVQSVDKVLVEEETSSEDKTKSEDKVASDDTVGVSSTAAPVHPTATQAEPSPSPLIGTPVESHNERQPQDKTEDEDDKAWRDYVENVGKTAPTAADTKPASGGASAWNAYAGRLHQKEEDKWSAAVKKYAEERNMDPEVFEDLRPYVPPSTRLLHRAPPSQQQQQQQRGGRPAFSGGHAQRSHDRRTSRSDHPRLDHRRSSATSTTASIPTPSEPAEAEPRRRRSPSSKATERQKVLSPSTEESSHAESLQETSVHRRHSPSSRTTERRKVPSPSTGESSSRFESLRKLPTVTPHDEPVWADLVCLRKAQRQAALRGASRPVFPAAVDRAASTLAGRHFCFTSSPSLGGGLTRDSTPPPPPSALPVLAFPIGGTTPPISPGVWSAVVAMASAPPSSQLPSGVPAT